MRVLQDWPFLSMNLAAEHGNNISSNLWLRPGCMPGSRVHSGRRRVGAEGNGGV